MLEVNLAEQGTYESEGHPRAGIVSSSGLFMHSLWYYCQNRFRQTCRLDVWERELCLAKRLAETCDACRRRYTWIHPSTLHSYDAAACTNSLRGSSPSACAASGSCSALPREVGCSIGAPATQVQEDLPNCRHCHGQGLRSAAPRHRLSRCSVVGSESGHAQPREAGAMLGGPTNVQRSHCPTLWVVTATCRFPRTCAQLRWRMLLAAVAVVMYPRLSRHIGSVA